MILTTITPYWGRPEALRIWMRAIDGATVPGVRHLIFFVGESPPDWFRLRYSYATHIQAEVFLGERGGDKSIAYWHTLGARLSSSKWIMKMDVDALPNVRYFRELLPILRGAREREWFNGGMVYATQGFSQSHLKEEQMPLTESTYTHLMNLRHLHCTCSKGPEATNFICRREDYLALGGGDSRFRGWGWEDYQQIYMLERYWRQSDPLPGEVTLANITHRCRLEISQPKARELW